MLVRCTVVAATVLAAAGCVDVVAVDGGRYVDRVEKRFTVSGRPDLTVSTFDGSIEVRSWDGPEVLVVVERRAATRDAIEGIEVKADQDGERITVSARRHGDRVIDWSFGGRSASLVVSLPASADLSARSGDGWIDVEGLTGRIDLRSGDGAIRGRRLSGELSVGTGDGSIKISDVQGTLSARTGDGSVAVEGAFTGVTVRTGDGTVTLAASAGSTAADDWSISTGDGSVTLELPDRFNAELDAHTGDGRIAVDNLSVSNVMGRMAKNRLRGQLGTGGGALKIRTGDGSITLRKNDPGATAHF